MEPTDELTSDESAACRAIFHLSVALPRAVDAQLTRWADMTLFEYDVLSTLATAPSRARRLSDLRDWAPLTLSGLSRLVYRLRRRGWVERGLSFDDGRSHLAVLTEAGLKALEAARPVHDGVLRRLVLGHLAGLDLTELTPALEAMGTPNIRDESSSREIGPPAGPAAEDLVSPAVIRTFGRHGRSATEATADPS